MTSSPQHQASLTLTQKALVLAERHDSEVFFERSATDITLVLLGSASLWVSDRNGVAFRVRQFSKMTPKEQREVFKDFAALAHEASPMDLLVSAIRLVEETPPLKLRALNSGNNSSFVEISMYQTTASPWFDLRFSIETSRNVGCVEFRAGSVADLNSEALKVFNKVRAFADTWTSTWRSKPLQIRHPT